jgi:uncharacterized protein YceH (UPF0502 family)
MPEVMHLNPGELALMCVLMLRGPQTTGEMRGNSARLHEFSGLDEVDVTVNSLISHDPEPLVVRLPRQAGQKEARFAHILSGEVPVESQTDEAPPMRSRGRDERVAALEGDIETLKSEVAQLREQFEGFRKQFE